MAFGGGERLAGLLSDPASRGILGASAGLLAAGAPRTDRPVSLGEAISSGLLSGAQAFDAATQRQADQAAADELSALRKARMAALSKPERITPGTDIGKIRLDLAEGRITPQDAERLIAQLFKKEEKLPLSPQGELAYDKANFPQLFSSEQPVADITVPELDAPNLRAASTGDITGMAANASNFVAGLFGGSAFPETQEAKAQLNLLNEAILTPMVRAISDRGAVYTQQRMRELLPQTGLSDAENAARMRQLPTKMRQQIASAEATLADDTQSDKAKAEANKAIRELTPLLTTIERSLSQFDTTRSRDPRGNRRRRSGTVDSSQGPIKFKLIKQGNDGNN